MKSTVTFSPDRGISKMLKLNFLVTVLCVCFSFLSYGQSTTGVASGDSMSTAIRQYVKIQIGMHILDCPVLPKSLRGKLASVKGMQNYREDAFTQSIYFDIPEGAITKEQIIATAISCAFPKEAVSVLMESKPFPN